jgi:hypothetical protein
MNKTSRMLSGWALGVVAIGATVPRGLLAEDRVREDVQRIEVDRTIENFLLNNVARWAKPGELKDGKLRDGRKLRFSADECASPARTCTTEQSLEFWGWRVTFGKATPPPQPTPATITPEQVFVEGRTSTVPMPPLPIEPAGPVRSVLPMDELFNPAFFDHGVVEMVQVAPKQGAECQKECDGPKECSPPSLQSVANEWIVQTRNTPVMQTLPFIGSLFSRAELAPKGEEFPSVGPQRAGTAIGYAAAGTAQAPAAPVHEKSPAEHLRLAARQLEAGGLKEDAEHLRQQADQIDSRLQKRVAEIETEMTRLQNELKSLRSTVGELAQIQIHTQILEFDCKKLRTPEGEQLIRNSLGSRFDATRPADEQVGEAATNPQFVKAATTAGFCKVLADPVLVTTPGRPASILSGGEFPVVTPDHPNQVQFREFGLRLEVCPVILDDGRVRLDFAPEYSERSHKDAVMVNGLTVPGLKTRRMNAQIDMRVGQTAAVAGLRTGRAPSKNAVTPVEASEPAAPETETVFLVTVIVSPPMSSRQ